MRSIISRPQTVDETLIGDQLLEDESGLDDESWSVILYNDDYHPITQVVDQLIKATTNSRRKCVEITLEAHSNGRSVAQKGSESICRRCAKILQEIKLRVDVEKLS